MPAAELPPAPKSPPQETRPFAHVPEDDLLAFGQQLGVDCVYTWIKAADRNYEFLARLRERTLLPLAVYQVSGEYAMLKAAAAHGWLDERACALESLTAIKRAGGDMILTVSFGGSTWNHLPYRFEAGTPNIAVTPCRFIRPMA